MKTLIFITFLFLLSFTSNAQITAFSETFESVNSLTLVNGTQTNKWLRGSANQCNGAFSLFISNNGSAYAYTNTSASTVHAYFDVAIPAGSTNIQILFNRKLAGEASFDYLQSWSCINTFAPTAGNLVTANSNRVLLGTLQGVTTCATTTYNVANSVAGTTRRFIFTWRNDNSAGTNPPALIDNIIVRYTPAAPAPSNDGCSNATSLPCATSNLAGTTVSSVVETSPSTCVGGYGVWYSFVGDGQSTTISVTSATDMGLYIGSGNCTTRTQIACEDFYFTNSTETASFSTVNGTTYYVYVAYYGTGVITGAFTISRTCVTVPANNLCANATAITLQCPGTTISTSGTTIGATEDAILDPSCDPGDIRDVWYSFNTGNNTKVSITTTLGTASWLGVEIYTSCGTVATGLSFSCDFDILSPNPTTITGFSTNTAYRLRIFTNATYDIPGTFSIYLNGNPPVSTPSTITGNSNIIAGTSETYSIPTDPNATAYQWDYRESSTSPWVTNTSSTTSATVNWPLMTTNGEVLVTVSNGCGSQSKNLLITVDGVLPVELLYFIGTEYPTYNLLQWATASEQISDYFEIHESLDGISWKPIGIKSGSGNSNSLIYYSYSIFFNEYAIHYYRLKQVDYDGNFEIFDIIALDNTRSYMKVVKYVNLIGQEVGPDTKGIMFEIYEDGSAKKIIR